VVAAQAALARHLAAPLRDAAVAEPAVEALAGDDAVIEARPGRGAHEPVGDLVAGHATAAALVRRLVLEMTERADAGGDADVLVLGLLGVARRAAELQSVARLTQVDAMVEARHAERSRALDQPALVAA